MLVSFPVDNFIGRKTKCRKVLWLTTEKRKCNTVLFNKWHFLTDRVSTCKFLTNFCISILSKIKAENLYHHLIMLLLLQASFLAISTGKEVETTLYLISQSLLKQSLYPCFENFTIQSTLTTVSIRSKCAPRLKHLCWATPELLLRPRDQGAVSVKGGTSRSQRGSWGRTWPHLTLSLTRVMRQQTAMGAHIFHRWAPLHGTLLAMT